MTASKSLISISPPDRDLDRALLNAPGGFLWWYVDLVDGSGNGIVLIWSYGLPFLPGYASAARRGNAQRPAERPSLNVSVYRNGAPDFYLLQEYAPEQVTWSDAGNLWRFGDTRLEAHTDDDRFYLRAELDCPVHGTAERLTGRLEVDGPCRLPAADESEDRDHLHGWTPRVGPARGQADLSHARRRWRMSGRAYHDRNGGSVPLHELGIDYWLWGRVPQADRELIYYLLWADDAAMPVCKALTIDGSGATDMYDEVTVEVDGARRSLGGLVWWETLTLVRSGAPWITVQHDDVVDNGPFYMRFLTCAVDRRQPSTTHGIGELVKPDRIDLARHRPLVRMRVHQVDEPNSMWLPLFTGPKDGRVRRLVGSWIGGGDP